jgi:fatty acid desaturase
MFPGMPYHNLATAHSRLMTQLPADHPYRSSVYPSMWAVLKELISEVRANTSHGSVQQFGSESAGTMSRRVA